MLKELKERLLGKGYEVGTGSPVRKVDAGSGCQYYRVELRRKADGKAVRKNFTTAQKAGAYASKSQVQKAAGAPAGGNAIEAHREAMEILNPFQASLSEAASFYARFHGGGDRERSVSSLTARFLAEKEALLEQGEMTSSSLVDVRHFLKRFAREFGPRAVDMVPPGELDHFLDEISGTANRRSHRLYISAFFNWSVAQGLLESNPVHKTRRVQKRRQSPGIYTAEEVECIMAAAEDDLIPYLALSFFSGALAREILRLRWADIDFEHHQIHVRGEGDERDRTLRMTAGLAAFLIPFRGMPGGLVVPHIQRSLQRWSKKLFDQVGVAPIYQGARHTFATYHLALHPLAETMQEIGCSRNSTLFKYCQAGEKLRCQATAYFAIRPHNRGDIIPLEQEAA